MKATTSAKPMRPVVHAHLDGIGAEVGADGAFFDDRQLGAAGRRRAAALRESLRFCAVKLPEIWPEPPVIGSRMTGALSTLPSSTMAKGLPTLCAGDFARSGWRRRCRSGSVTIGSLVF